MIYKRSLYIEPANHCNSCNNKDLKECIRIWSYFSTRSDAVYICKDCLRLLADLIETFDGRMM